VDGVRRGDLVTIVLQGDFGKPRPALVIQSDQFDAHATVTILPLSSTLVEAPLFRLTVTPTTANGLKKPSQVMVDKTMTVNRDKLGEVFGRVDDSAMVAVNRALALFLGFA
jgi:mRNA interferase MazF